MITLIPNSRYPILLTLVCLLASFSMSFGQDILYLTDNTRIRAKVLQVDTKVTCKLVDGNKPEVQKFPLKQVSLICFQEGDVQVFINGQNRLFPYNHLHYDKVILRSGKMVAADHLQLESDRARYINLNRQADGIFSTAKSSLIAIFYRDKTQEFFVPVARVAQYLMALKEPPFVPELDESQLPENRNTSETPPTAAAPSDPQPQKQNFEPATSQPPPSTPPVRKVVKTPPPARPTPKEKEGLPVDEAEFKRRALNKTRRLTQYITVISNKNTPSIEASKTITEAIVLFISDTCIVQVSNINSPNKIIEKPIRTYLTHVKLLKYDKVEIEWADVNYVGEIRKGPDGNYYGYVTFLQRFKGIKDQQVVYEDQTTKKVEVIFKGYSKLADGVSVDLWDVLLSNIKVEQTSRI